MRSALTIGSIAGIPIKIHWNWLITALLVTWSLASAYFPQENPGWSAGIYWVAGMATALLFFLSVLLHELGHAAVAVREGVEVQSITLFLFGGVAHIASEPETPGSEFRIVAAGPLTSLALALGYHLAGFATSGHPVLEAGALYLSRINLILAAFNLVPGFPLDGGRILRSAIWKVVGSFNKATRWATNVGFGVAGLFFATGAAFIYFGNLVGGLWIAFIGGYLGLVSRGARLQVISEEQEHQLIERALSSPAYAPPPLVGRKLPAPAVLEAPVFIAVPRVVRINEQSLGQDTPASHDIPRQWE